MHPEPKTSRDVTSPWQRHVGSGARRLYRSVPGPRGPRGKRRAWLPLPKNPTPRSQPWDSSALCASPYITASSLCVDSGCATGAKQRTGLWWHDMHVTAAHISHAVVWTARHGHWAWNKSSSCKTSSCCCWIILVRQMALPVGDLSSIVTQRHSLTVFACNVGYTEISLWRQKRRIFLRMLMNIWPRQHVCHPISQCHCSLLISFEYGGTCPIQPTVTMNCNVWHITGLMLKPKQL